MEFEDLRTFVSVAETGSVSHAARQMFVTQPAVTRRLQRLETALGTTLVDRRRRPFSLTATGRTVLAECHKVLNKRDFKKSFAEYRAFREANVALLKSLTPEQWKICGIHKERGPETMETVAKMSAGHDLNHFQQIERIRASRAK